MIVIPLLPPHPQILQEITHLHPLHPPIVHKFHNKIKMDL
jgi:hypothetical protein